MARARELDRNARWVNIGMIFAMACTIAGQALQLKGGVTSVWPRVALIAACAVVLVVFAVRLLPARRNDYV